MYNENAWKKYTDKDLNDVKVFNDEYIKFISENKTEREVTASSVKLLEAKGYKNLYELKSIKANDKVYATNKNKNVVAFIVGSEDILNGINILGAHIDSPRIDLKQNPLYEASDYAYFDTHYYGGVKKYQWVTIPLAIHGVVCLKTGKTVNISIGEDAQDPVFVISDLLIHLSDAQMKKNVAKVVEGETLNVTVGSIPLKGEKKDAVKANMLKLLNQKYGFEEDDFVSAELEVVPAGPARSCGLDSSFVLGYGHDDRVCAYSSLMAQLEAKNVKRTAVTLLVDKEEVGYLGQERQRDSLGYLRRY